MLVCIPKNKSLLPHSTKDRMALKMIEDARFPNGF